MRGGAGSADSVGWAGWLVAYRGEIERGLTERLGPERPDAGSAETEALRRFRSFAISALRRGAAAGPALDGLRIDPHSGTWLVERWCDAACDAAPGGSAELRALLRPLVERFRHAVLAQTAARRARGAPRIPRRAVTAAIDRISDAFLAVDVDTGLILDANPAAGALLGLRRDALLGCEAPRFVHEDAREGWASHLEALAESPEPRRFRALLRDVRGGAIPVEVNATLYARRTSTLALVVARPTSGAWSGHPER
jgi:PAS domain S-box-containing protein